MATTTVPKNEFYQWGLPFDEIKQMGQSLTDFYDRFRLQMRTQTHDTSEYGLCYLSGLLRMETKRNIANIGRKTNVTEQNMQHFMSNSPWSGQGLVNAIQNDIKRHPEFQSGAICHFSGYTTPCTFTRRRPGFFA